MRFIHDWYWINYFKFSLITLNDPRRHFDTSLIHLVFNSSGTYFCARSVPIHVLVRYPFIYSYGTCFWASPVPIYLIVCIRHQSSCSICARRVPVLHLQAWIFEQIFFRWVQGACWFKHPLFIENHDTLHTHALRVMRTKSFPWKMIHQPIVLFVQPFDFISRIWL